MHVVGDSLLQIHRAEGGAGIPEGRALAYILPATVERWDFVMGGAGSRLWAGPDGSNIL